MSAAWAQDESDEYRDSEAIRAELRESMVGYQGRTSERLSMAIYEAVERDGNATADDVLDIYLERMSER